MRQNQTTTDNNFICILYFFSYFYFTKKDFSKQHFNICLKVVKDLEDSDDTFVERVLLLTLRFISR